MEPIWPQAAPKSGKKKEEEKEDSGSEIFSPLPSSSLAISRDRREIGIYFEDRFLLLPRRFDLYQNTNYWENAI